MFHCRMVLPAYLFLALAFVADAQQIQPPAKDPSDDPLPAGAVARLGPGRTLHSISPTFLQFLPDGRRVITVSDNSTVSRRILRVWELPFGKEISRIDLPLTGPYAFSPDGIHLATGEADGTIRIWEWANAKQVHSFAERSHVGGGFPLVVALGADGKRRASSLSIRLAYAPDGKSIVSGPLQQKDKTYVLKLWDLATGATVCTVPVPSRSLDALLFSPDAKTLAACHWDTAVLWDATTGQRIGPPPMPELTLLPSSNLNIIYAKGNAAFSPDGRCLVVDLPGGTAGLYEVATRQLRRAFSQKLEKSGTTRSLEPTSHFAFSPAGKSLARAGRSGAVYLYDVLTCQELAAFTGHQDLVNAIAFAPNGKMLATASDDTTALVWDVTTIARPAAAARAVQAVDLEMRWQALAGNDAAKAFEAIRDLTAASKEAVPWIKERLKPAAPHDMKRVEDLLKQLDSDQFKVRDTATRDLLKLDEQLVPALDKALAANPSLESKQRLEGLRDKMVGTVLQGKRLRAYRAIEVLEHMGASEARQVLQALADGAPGALITTSAQAALKR